MKKILKKIKLGEEIPPELADVLPSIIRTGKFKKAIREALSTEMKGIARDFVRKELEKYDLSMFVTEDTIMSKLSREVSLAVEDLVRKKVREFMLYESDKISEKIVQMLKTKWEKFIESI